MLVSTTVVGQTTSKWNLVGTKAKVAVLEDVMIWNPLDDIGKAQTIDMVTAWCSTSLTSDHASDVIVGVAARVLDVIDPLTTEDSLGLR